MWSKCQCVLTTYFTGALPRPSRAFLSLGHAGATKQSTTNLPSGPLRTTTLPPGPESIVMLSASFWVLRGKALNQPRIFARRSAAEGACARAGEARSNGAGEKFIRNALPASVTEPRNMSRREVCFCKKLEFISFSPFLCHWDPTGKFGWQVTTVTQLNTRLTSAIERRSSVCTFLVPDKGPRSESC